MSVTTLAYAVGFSLLLWGIPSQAQDVRFHDCGPAMLFLGDCAPPPDSSAPPVPVAPPSPLFTPETVARDTPPVMLDLLNEPTPDRARAFLAWQQTRLARIKEVTALLQRLAKERQP